MKKKNGKNRKQGVKSISRSNSGQPFGKPKNVMGAMVHGSGMAFELHDETGKGLKIRF